MLAAVVPRDRFGLSAQIVGAGVLPGSRKTQRVERHHPPQPHPKTLEPLCVALGVAVDVVVLVAVHRHAHAHAAGQ